ncbi:PREDICTED: cytochrome P450 6k1-like isoform X1 [Wasmannia auropunctata]|uniref:cytochrome P450 6k1-like isoform X1 n=1 Tax=Wasmannia auropunctata TaxID=64793 RepID=UPI0005ED5BA4|nr:PREDICTED: cytochrome P450 6k1-like isoform X1 [Wasmannia auropunctata]
MKYKDHRAFGMYTLFKPNLVVADPDLIRAVLTKEFRSFHDRGMYNNEKTDPFSGGLFFMSEEKKWRNMHIQMTPIFTSGKIKQMFPILKKCSEQVVKYLEKKAQIRDSVEMKDMFARYAMDVIMSVAFGVKSNCIEEPNNEYRIQGKKILDGNTFWIALFLFVPQIMDYFSIPLTDRKVTSFYTNIFRKTVEYRQTHNIVRHDFMNMLIQLMKGYTADNDKNKSC